MKDFFISYTGVDQAWAEWVAKQLEDAGYSTTIQAWDFLPGGNFVKDMQRATLESKRTIAVLSDAYFQSGFAESEWAVAFAGDSQTEKRKVIPIRIESFQPYGLLSPIVYIDLVGLDVEGAQAKLIQNIEAILQGNRLKPDSVPFPGIESKISSELFPEVQADNPLISISPPAECRDFNAKLIDFLEQHQIPLQRAQSAFLKCLPSGWPDEKRMVMNYHDLVNRLQLVMQGESSCDATTQFFGHLSQDSQLRDQTRSEIQTWASKSLPGWSEWLTSLSSATASESDCSTLMIYLQRCDSGQSQKHSMRYYLDAWFALDPQTGELSTESSPKKLSIAGNQSQKIELSEMSSVLTRFLQKIQLEHSPKHLTLEFFLPLELLNYAVEHWVIEDDLGLEDISVGHEYPVVLRCAERIEPSFLYRSSWEQRWEHLQQALSQNACSLFTSGDAKKPKDLYGEISTRPDLVGLMLSQVPEKMGKGSVFAVILKAGIPLAIWVRALLTKIDCVQEMNQLLQCNLGLLPEAVKEKRLSSLQSSVEVDEDMGHHLSLIWDNPYCVPQLSNLEMS